MRIIVLADIHSNLTAFEAVLKDAAQRGKIDWVWCPGDIIGYGPDPRECIALVQKLGAVCVAGNHDFAAVGKIDTSDFNPAAAAANRWTAQQLKPEDIAFLSDLPLTVVRDDFTVVHGSPREPVWEYLFDVPSAKENLAHFTTPYGIVGHTHVPCVFVFGRFNEGGVKQLRDGDEVLLDENRLILNPGGVGQPRDGDPRASYGILDTDRRIFTLHRVPYDIPTVQARMREKGLPEMLWKRLEWGR
ncbi:MAG: metallophosphoesterase family protein [Dehalococcoidia bacterium]|nr:metallophosphoesterase family protein [Dehalococcoidia bacterium]